MWFRGLSKLSVDAKGRVAMPKAHRDVLEESEVTELVITASGSRCLNVYSKDEWDAIEKAIMETPNVKHRGVQKMQRLYLGYATTVGLDSAGRIALSAEQRRFARIDRKAMFVGQGKKFEIWDEDRWEREFDMSEDHEDDHIDLSDVPDELLNLAL